MASSVKPTLMFMLLVAMAMAMAAQVSATGHNVSCKNEYCEPITVNNIAIAVGATVEVFVDGAYHVQSAHLIGGDRRGLQLSIGGDRACICWSWMLCLVVKVVGSTLDSLLNLILGILGGLKVTLGLCL